MSHGILGKVLNDRPRAPSFGADTEPKGWEEVIATRVDRPPVKFAGRQITHHWARIFSGEVLAITLWERSKSGYQVLFTAFVAGELRTDSVAVDSILEAITFLEDNCAHPMSGAAQTDQLIDSVLHLYRSMTYSRIFAALAGEALAAWSIYGQVGPQGRVKEKAQA